MKTPVFNIADDWQSEGSLTDASGGFISNLVQQLQLNFPDDGYIIPSISNDNVKKLEIEKSSDGSRNSSYFQTKLVHDSTNNVYRVNDKKGKYLAIQTKLTTKWDETKEWVTTERKLTQDAIDFLNQLVEEKS